MSRCDRLFKRNQKNKKSSCGSKRRLVKKYKRLQQLREVIEKRRQMMNAVKSTVNAVNPKKGV